MTFLGISFLIPLMFQEEQSTKDEAPTKESALTGQRPALFPRMALSKLQMHSVAESIKDDNLLRQDAHCSDSEFIKHKRADQVHLCFCFLERCRLRHRHLFFRSCLEKLWAPSRASCNRLCHATYGNTWCQRCGLFLGNWYFYNYPARFRSQPVHLQNGMLVHHFRICTHHLSVWFFRRGLRIFRTFFGNAKLNLIKQLEAAGAASGLPGDHGYSPHTQYFQYQRYTLRPVASGHESRSASGGKKRHHQNLRSESSRYLRIQKYQNNRRKSRQAYRQWKRSASSPANLTLAQYCPPPKRVQVSVHQRNRFAGPRDTPTCTSRAFFFKKYVHRDRLSLPPIRFRPMAPPGRQLLLYSWNVETLLGVGKYEMLAHILNAIQCGIVCLQETKSTTTDHIRALNWHFYLSGESTDPHAGVGFAVPDHLHPLVLDFVPLTSRIALLQLCTKPLPISLFSVYAPSQVADADLDRSRKNAFWLSLQSWYAQYAPHTYPVLMGDFNTRLYSNQLDGLGHHIGPVVFSMPTEADLSDNNFTHMLDFLVQHDLSIVSSMRPRPPSKLVTYREIADLTDDPVNPTIDNFAVLDHVITPHKYRTCFGSIRSVPSVRLPWFHRHYLLLAKFVCSGFITKPSRSSPPHYLPPTTQQQQAFQEHVGAYFQQLSGIPIGTPVATPTPGSLNIYTDGSCPDQLNVGPDNPAGWGVFIDAPFNIDLFGSVGHLPFAVQGSNNTGELQAVLEALLFLPYLPTYPTAITLHTDSTYVHDLLLGLSLPSTNHDLVNLLLNHLNDISTRIHISIVKVKGHSGNAGNDRADANAARGINSSTRNGRYTTFPPALLPVASDPLPAWFSTLSLSQQTDHFVQSLATAASTCFTRKPPFIRKPYLSPTTQAELVNLNTVNLSSVDLATLRRQIRAHARRDKKRWILQQLEIDHRSSPSQRWKTIRRVRTNYQPRTQSVCWPSGRPSTAVEKPEVLAQHLRDNVWKPTECPPPNVSPLFPTIDEAFSPFTLTELHVALRRLKSRKAPGPDSISPELYKLLPFGLRRLLLEHFNSCLLSASAPDHWKLARVVMIFKGGTKNSRHPSSYRPISLANSIYKLYAALIQARLAKHFDSRISEFQYGFRKKRSPANPLFLIRRLVELFERHTTSLYILFLDWSQAFDCINHSHLTASLVRIGLPFPLVHAISALYANGQFFVTDSSYSSSTYSLSRGIRQGCPLSPYLFILVLSVLMHDVHTTFASLYHFTPWTFSTRTPLSDVEYADDTVLIARAQLTLHRLLHTLQHEACKRGLLLNPEKCQLLQIHTNLPIHLSPAVDPQHPCPCHHCTGAEALGAPLRVLDTAKYLGARISSDASSTADCNYRYSQASGAISSLFPVFTNPAIPIKRRLDVYSQIVLAILLYACDSQVYTPAQIVKFNSLHYRVLRQIFGVKSSYYHRVISPSQEDCSNDYLLSLAFRHAPRLLLPSQRISVQRLRYLGHIIRHFESVEHKMIFHPSHSFRRLSSPMRPGRPRTHWPEIALAEAYHRGLQIQQHQHPSTQEIHHPIYQLATTATVQQYFGPSLSDWYDTTRIYRALQPVAEDRVYWDQIVFPGK